MNKIMTLMMALMMTSSDGDVFGEIFSYVSAVDVDDGVDGDVMWRSKIG